MSTRAQQAQLLRNQGFIDQIQGALIAAVVNVLNEPSEAADHESRLKWANAIIGNRDAQTQFFITGMLTNPAIAGNAGDPSSISDGDVEYVIASLFTKYAIRYAAQNTIGVALELGSS